MRIFVSGNTAVLRRVGRHHPDYCGVLLTPANRNSIASVLKTGFPWAVDNGAFGGFDPVSFRRCLRRVAKQPRLLWVACPDAVGDAQKTLTLFDQWYEEIA